MTAQRNPWRHRVADLWVINPKYVPKPNSAHEGDYEKFKRRAEIRMRQYDRLPKTVRRAVNQFGMLADARRWRYATEKIDAVSRYAKDIMEALTILTERKEA